MYHNFIGIDIGKDELFVGINGRNNVERYANKETGFISFYKHYESELRDSLVVLETTGGYEYDLIRFLQDREITIHRANTRKVKFFIRSHGCLGKSDKIDALALAKYGAERYEDLSVFKFREDAKLFQLVNRRIELKQMLVKEKNRLQSPEQRLLKNSYETVILALEAEILLIEERIDAFISADPTFQKKLEVLMTIPGVGKVTAIQLLCLLPELGQVDRKEIASLGGVAPHPNESGKRTGYRRTRGGRTSVKPVLFMSALSASKSNSFLGDCYKSFLERGKKKMVALTALMRKILVIANARLRDHRLDNEVFLNENLTSL